jgi:DNA-binding Lrp family transcriptional regulator
MRGGKMSELREMDRQEKMIVRELIRNPRISDNQIAKNTKIPVMTVNRKRKNLEKEGNLRYFCSLDTGEHGTGKYKAKQLYIIKFKIGITRQQFIDNFEQDRKFLAFGATYVSVSYIGEKDGHLAYLCIIDAETESAMLDQFNEKVIPLLKEKFGEDCIQEITTMKITNNLRRHHNYMPYFNMENGIMKKNWPNEYIFIDEGPESAKAKTKQSSD